MAGGMRELLRCPFKMLSLLSSLVPPKASLCRGFFPLNYKLSAECIDIIPSKGYDFELPGSNSERKFRREIKERGRGLGKPKDWNHLEATVILYVVLVSECKWWRFHNWHRFHHQARPSPLVGCGEGRDPWAKKKKKITLGLNWHRLCSCSLESVLCVLQNWRRTIQIQMSMI